VFRVVIPARIGSTRLPGKPLLMLAGKAMIQWVYERARRSGAQQVIVATDDERIAQLVRELGGEACLTAATHASGTDRVAEVARRERWADADIVVNLQGDEPLMPEALLVQVARLLAGHAGADLATLSVPLDSVAALLDPNVVKVVTDQQQRALYFSRAPIPWSRDAAPGVLSSQRSHAGARRHLGLYAYRVSALLRLAALPPSALEQIEKLEQLRALEHAMDIRVAHAEVAPGPDVNTADDLAEVAALLEAGR
jgi:3-deoxy-manno-octulosonate cytidylyltransferase (CMP-KDO synthetase)